jgi:hypothetical protein
MSDISPVLPYCPPVPVRVIPLVILIFLLSACAGNIEEAGKPAVVTGQPGAGPTRAASTVMPKSGMSADEKNFWEAVEDARARGGGDPEAMAEVLQSRFADADDQTLRQFQGNLIDASTRLYTWQHWNAAEMICRFTSDDVFTDWRSWVIAQGRETFTRVAENPDNLADVSGLSESCEAGGEFFGAAVHLIYFNRHGPDDETFPILMPIESPSGKQLTNPEDIRRAMPRLAARLRGDGLWRPPRASN